MTSFEVQWEGCDHQNPPVATSLTVTCQKNIGPPAEVKMCGSEYKAHDANYLKRTKEVKEKTRNQLFNVEYK